MTRTAGVLLSLAVFGLLACDGAHRQPPVSPPSGPTAGLTLGGRKIDVTLVLTEKDRRHALRRLEPHTESQGTLLAWPRDRFCKIESEGSRVPFDLVFFNKSGTILDLRPLKANDEEGVVPKLPAAYALLVAPGLPQKLGLKVDDRVTLSPEILSAKPEELPEMRINGVSAAVELALSEDERQHGLMFRLRMSADDGMLFAYPDEGERRFWMANTLIPLDIAFFSADGTLLNVNETPMYDNPRVPGALYATSDSKGAARFVLEMNLGWFKKKGIVDGSGRIVPGTKAELPPQARKGNYD